LLMYLLVFLLIPSALAVSCYDSTTKSSCCGDYCYAYRSNYVDNSTIRETGCLRGSIFRPFIGKCLEDNDESYCFCDTDYCNSPTARYPEWKHGTLKCGQTKGCISCEVHRSLSGSLATPRCGSFFAKSIEIVMQTQSCVRFQISEYDNKLYCLCDTGNNCDTKLIKAQKLTSNKVTCLMERSGKETCKGDFCFISQWYDLMSVERGCITNNETLYAGLYQSGYANFLGYQYILCESDKCNKDWKTAEKSADIKEPLCHTTTITTTMSPSEILEADFQRQWNNLIYSLRNAFSDIMWRLQG
ncbi:hypothetical protein PMAYCL1PPCAC_20125, partial [Pristionchus mayeri]